MTIQPYLNFDGRADEAAAFYQKAFGAEVQMLMRYKDSPDPCPEGMIPAGSENKVMHMSLKIGDSVVMGSDGAARARPASRAFPCLTPRRMPRKRTACSPRSPMAERRKCRWGKHSFRRGSAWSRTASASPGW